MTPINQAPWTSLGRIQPEEPMRADRALSDARILVVDDEEANCVLLRKILERAGYRHVQTTTDPRQVLELDGNIKPDLIVLDLHMPHIDGHGLLEQLAERSPEGVYRPVLVVTGDESREARWRALAAGAKDFVTKPFDALEILLRIQNLLETRVLYLQLHHQNEILEEKVLERTRRLEEAQEEILKRLARTVEFRDDLTGKHAERGGNMAALLSRMLGWGEEQVELIRQASQLHDVGKVAIPDSILMKPGALTPEEVEVMQRHPSIGAEILSGSRSPLLQMAEEIALNHHERWDGTGYPRGLKGDEIPMAARIVAVADVFDALTQDRPYRPAWPRDQVIEEIRRQGGRHFDPKVVKAFLAVVSPD